MRGGHRRNYIVPVQEARVWCSGRWGARRVRVTECVTVLKAEDSYTELIRLDPSKCRPGARGRAHFTMEGRTHAVEWIIRPNAIWRFGRVFLRCPQCDRQVTRVYLPTRASALACRICWGLSYSSRQNSYKYSGWAAVLGPIGPWETMHARERRAEAEAERAQERRALLDRP